MTLDNQAYWDVLINRSACRFFLLAALAEGPKHGYQLAKSVEEATNACCTPSAAMIYPALRELVEGGYINCQTERTGLRERKVCSLTPKGYEAFQAAARSWARILPAISIAIEQASSTASHVPAAAGAAFSH